MSGPGGAYGQSGQGGQDDDATRAAQTPGGAPWDPPPVDYPHTDHPPPNYPGYPPSPPGYQPPGYGASYPPAPMQYGAGYPSPGGGYYAPVGTNGLAIGSLVSSIFGLLCCPIIGIVSVALGIVALNQIKQTNQDGHGLAVAGIVIGGIAIAWQIVIFFIFLAARTH